VLGKKSLYLSMLHKFLAGQKSAATSMRKALDANEWDGAQRLAHTLKGVSGNIGATLVQQLAQNFEAAITKRLPQDAIDESLALLKTPLDTLIAQLEQKLPKQRLWTAIPVDKQALEGVCDELGSLLAVDDAQARNVFNANEDLLHSAFPAQYQSIETGIRSFDFVAARAALKAARGASTWKTP
jgi:two-component system sensor histidine kinase/response regulator